MVGDPDLPPRIAQQPPDHGGADRPGAAGNQDAVHRREGVLELTRPVSAAYDEHLARAERVPRIDEQAVRRRRGDDRFPEARSGPRTPNGWWRRSPRRRRARLRASGCVGVRACGSHTATSASSRSSRRISFGDSESRSSSVSRLKVSPSTATLREDSVAEPALDPLDQEQRHRLVDAGDRQQHAGGVRSAPRRRRSPCAGRCRRSCPASRSRRAGNRG